MEVFRPPHGNLFKKYTSSHLETCLRNSINKLIHDLDDNYVLNVSETEYIEYLTLESQLFCPVLLLDEKYLEPRNVLVPTEFLPYSWFCSTPVEKKIYRLFIPFSGDSQLLDFRPSTFTLSCWSNMSFSNNSVYVDILDLEGNLSNLKRDVESYIGTLTIMLGYLAKDVERINRDINSWVTSSFRKRKDDIIASKKGLAEIGIPIKSGSVQPKTYSVPVVKRRIQQPKLSSAKVPGNLDPALSEIVYEDILSCIESIGHKMEQHPDLHRGMDEETLRAQFLTQLSATFESLSSVGEAFNNKGKTDIMVMKDNSILFVAECKIWKGPKVLLAAIDQLLSYLTWKDSKTALLLFNREISFSTILQSIPSIVESHPCFISRLAVNNSRFDYEFHLPDDHERKLRMSILVFDYKK